MHRVSVEFIMDTGTDDGDPSLIQNIVTSISEDLLNLSLITDNSCSTVKFCYLNAE